MDRIPSPNREDPRADDLSVREPVHPETRDAVHIVDDGRTRQLTGDATINPFEISDIMAKYAPTRGEGTPEQIARETDFNWKRYEVYGQHDYAEWLTNERQGWRPVLHEMFPGRFAPAGTTGMVRVKDMVLMERPMRLTVQARQEEYAKANRQILAHRKTRASAPIGPSDPFVVTDRTTRESIEIPE